MKRVKEGTRDRRETIEWSVTCLNLYFVRGTALCPYHWPADRQHFKALLYALYPLNPGILAPGLLQLCSSIRGKFWLEYYILAVLQRCYFASNSNTNPQKYVQVGVTFRNKTSPNSCQSSVQLECGAW